MCGKLRDKTVLVTFHTKHESTPIGNVSRELDKNWLKSTCGFSRSSITGDEDMAAKLLYCPSQFAEPENHLPVPVEEDTKPACGGSRKYNPARRVGEIGKGDRS